MYKVTLVYVYDLSEVILAEDTITYTSRTAAVNAAKEASKLFYVMLASVVGPRGAIKVY